MELLYTGNVIVKDEKELDAIELLCSHLSLKVSASLKQRNRLSISLTVESQIPVNILHSNGTNISERSEQFGNDSLPVVPQQDKTPKAKSLTCRHCDASFRLKIALLRHMKEVHNGEGFDTSDYEASTSSPAKRPRSEESKTPPGNIEEIIIPTNDSSTLTHYEIAVSPGGILANYDDSYTGHSSFNDSIIGNGKFWNLRSRYICGHIASFRASNNTQITNNTRKRNTLSNLFQALPKSQNSRASGHQPLESVSPDLCQWQQWVSTLWKTVRDDSSNGQTRGFGPQQDTWICWWLPKGVAQWTSIITN